MNYKRKSPRYKARAEAEYYSRKKSKTAKPSVQRRITPKRGADADE